MSKQPDLMYENVSDSIVIKDTVVNTVTIRNCQLVTISNSCIGAIIIEGPLDCLDLSRTTVGDILSNTGEPIKALHVSNASNVRLSDDLLDVTSKVVIATSFLRGKVSGANMRNFTIVGGHLITTSTMFFDGMIVDAQANVSITDTLGSFTVLTLSNGTKRILFDGKAYKKKAFLGELSTYGFAPDKMALYKTALKRANSSKGFHNGNESQ